MIRYDFEEYTEWKLINIKLQEVSVRSPWIDVYITFELETDRELPEDLSSPSALIIYSEAGNVAQTILLDEGCDTEYRFTDSEKEQLLRFVEKQQIIKPLLDEK